MFRAKTAKKKQRRRLVKLIQEEVKYNIVKCNEDIKYTIKEYPQNGRTFYHIVCHEYIFNAVKLQMVIYYIEKGYDVKFSNDYTLEIKWGENFNG